MKKERKKAEEKPRTNIYISSDVGDILAQVNPKSKSEFFNDAAISMMRKRTEAQA